MIVRGFNFRMLDSFLGRLFAPQAPRQPLRSTGPRMGSKTPCVQKWPETCYSFRHIFVRQDFDTETAMSLIDPLQLMNMMGTSDRQRPTMTQASDFQSHIRQAIDTSALSTLGMDTGQTAMSADLMQNALRNIAAIMTPQPARRSIAAHGTANTDIGALSANFESGVQGPSAIGYDQNGGTSYGTYQIASKPGSMDRFIDFLRDKEPTWAQALENAGPADTGKTSGKMPNVWRELAASNGEKFAQRQREFIAATHYEPARSEILGQTGQDINTFPPAVREALWSTAVQHGPNGAARIFGQALGSLDQGASQSTQARRLISTVYNNRKSEFASSTPRVRNSVRNRMDEEKNMVLAMLDTQNSVA